jgi:hypothetical protein
MGIEEQKNFDIVGIHLEVVTVAAIMGAILPIIFLVLNSNSFTKIAPLITIGFLFLLFSAGAFFIFYNSRILPRFLTPKMIRVWLYIFGIMLIGLTAILVINTGGIQSSIFNWLFEYALIVALLVREKGNDEFIVAIEIAIVSIAAFGITAINMPATIHIAMWAWISIIFALSGTIVTYGLAYYRYQYIYREGINISG